MHMLMNTGEHLKCAHARKKSNLLAAGPKILHDNAARHKITLVMSFMEE